jgi:hypothetical protein
VAAVAGEEKAVTSDRLRWAEKLRSAGKHRSWGREIDLRGVERRDFQRYSLQCSVPCMPVVSKAGNRVTWNHFLFCHTGRRRSS